MHVLYVEDEPDDVFLMERTFKKTAPEVQLKVITDGQAAAEFFSEPAAELSPSNLSLVILDLNLPGLSGLNVLAKIRSAPSTPKIPVIIFSASNQQADINACYAGGCNGYVVKPGDPDQLKAVISGVKDFWLRDNRRAQNQP